MIVEEKKLHFKKPTFQYHFNEHSISKQTWKSIWKIVQLKYESVKKKKKLFHILIKKTFSSSQNPNPWHATFPVSHRARDKRRLTLIFLLQKLCMEPGGSKSSEPLQPQFVFTPVTFWLVSWVGQEQNLGLPLTCLLLNTHSCTQEILPGPETVFYK